MEKKFRRPATKGSASFTGQPLRKSKPKSALEFIFGKHAVLEAVERRPDVVRELYVSADFTDGAYLERLLKTGLSPRPLNPKNPPRGISANAPHQGVVAGIMPERLMVPYADFITTFTPDAHTALLLLGEVQDPHNVGAVIRSAAAFGFAGVLIPPHNQAPVTGTVVKVSAGMAFRIPLVAIGNVNTTMRDLKDRGFWMYGLEGEGNASTTTEKFTHPTVFLLGNEGEGLREKTKELCDGLISIPIHPRCESLNAAAAAAIVMATWSAQHPKALSRR
ncbi:23S rRNA (guanosine(2251)-2'-O)-methyltransferase RlmB [Patescibacteria group bacterium]|nr:23S rRNA (guanosine(2251)-2'-O)-methyltransferase RlmB [Patescibacteria group bacterium]